MAETDDEFVERMRKSIGNVPGSELDAELDRLFALACRGAAVTEPMKLKIDEKQFLAAVDREGDHEVGVGKFPPSGEPRDE